MLNVGDIICCCDMPEMIMVEKSLKKEGIEVAPLSDYRLRIMKINNLNVEETEKPKTVTQLIEEIAEDFCNCYCKYPDMYNGLGDEAIDLMYENHCNNCPINRL